MQCRKDVIEQAAAAAAGSSGRWGIIMGTLGRQGSSAVIDRLETALRQAGKECFTVLMSEISFQKVRSVCLSVFAADQ